MGYKGDLADEGLVLSSEGFEKIEGELGAVSWPIAENDMKEITCTVSIHHHFSH